MPEGVAMSKEAVIDFLKNLDENEQLQKKLDAIPAKSRDAAKVVHLAKDNGFDFTETELEQEAGSHAVATGKAIGEQELENVVGGMSLSSPFRLGQFSSHLLLSVYSLSSTIRKFNAG